MQKRGKGEYHKVMKSFSLTHSLGSRKAILAVSIITLAIIGLSVYSVSQTRSKQIVKQQADTTTLPDLLFTPDSPWNQPIGTNVQYDQNSAAYVNSISSGAHIATVFGFGMPIYISTASDPLYTVNDGDQGSDKAFAAHNPFHIPNTAAPAPGFGSDADHWMFVYDTTDKVLHEMWEANKSGNTWSAQVANAFYITGDGVKQTDGSNTDGNGGAYFADVVRHEDIQRGYINHALSLVIPNTASAFRPPLTQSDGHGSGTGSIPEGARLQLDPTFDCNSMSGASKGEIMVCKAFQTYGGYIRDSGAGGGTNMTIYFEGEDLSDPNRKPPTNPGDGGRSGGIFGNVGISDGTNFSHIPWNKLKVLAAWNSYTPITLSSAPTSSPTTPPSDTPAPTSAPSNTPIPSQISPTQPISPNSTILSLALCPHGIGSCGDNSTPGSGGNPSPLHTQRSVTLSLFDVNNALILSKSVSLSFDPSSGSFTGLADLGSLASGYYSVKLHMDGFLSARVPGIVNILSAHTTSIPLVPLIAGDMNNDNKLTNDDFSILSNCFGSAFTTSSCKSQFADINDDGVVDGVDYNILLREFSAQYGK